MNYKIFINFLRDRGLLNAFLMGIASGFPLLLIKNVLKLWLKDAGYGLSEITKISWMGIPYSLKFLWAPLLDHYQLTKYGRRKSWLVLCQFLLAICLSLLAITKPEFEFKLVFLLAFLIAMLSATQDIVIDAYRRESLIDSKLGIGSSLYVYGYRIALWFTRIVPIQIAASYSWQAAYLSMSAVMLLNCFISLRIPEPNQSSESKNISDSIILPLKEFFLRSGYKKAVIILCFILLYKIGDSLASVVTMPFYVDIGYTKSEIAWIDGNFGSIGVLSGLFAGASILAVLGVNCSLWIFGFLQILSTLLFASLAVFGKNIFLFAFTICFENIASGMGTAAFTAFMAMQTDRRYSATQYALLSAIMSIPLNVLGGFSGGLAESLGYTNFFTFCGIIGIPGILMLRTIAPWNLNPQALLVRDEEV